MMEKKLDAKEARVQIWEELLRVAKPDSKFSWQFSEFICDYEGQRKGHGAADRDGYVQKTPA